MFEKQIWQQKATMMGAIVEESLKYMSRLALETDNGMEHPGISANHRHHLHPR